MTLYIMVLLIVNSVALTIGLAALTALTVAWLKAEWRVYKLGGTSKWYRDPPDDKKIPR